MVSKIGWSTTSDSLCEAVLCHMVHGLELSELLKMMLLSSCSDRPRFLGSGSFALAIADTDLAKDSTGDMRSRTDRLPLCGKETRPFIDKTDDDWNLRLAVCLRPRASIGSCRSSQPRRPLRLERGARFSCTQASPQ